MNIKINILTIILLVGLINGFKFDFKHVAMPVGAYPGGVQYSNQQIFNSVAVHPNGSMIFYDPYPSLDIFVRDFDFTATHIQNVSPFQLTHPGVTIGKNNNESYIVVGPGSGSERVEYRTFAVGNQIEFLVDFTVLKVLSGDVGATYVQGVDEGFVIVARVAADNLANLTHTFLRINSQGEILHEQEYDFYGKDYEVIQYFQYNDEGDAVFYVVEPVETLVTADGVDGCTDGSPCTVWTGVTYWMDANFTIVKRDVLKENSAFYNATSGHVKHGQDEKKSFTGLSLSQDKTRIALATNSGALDRLSVTIMTIATKTTHEYLVDDLPLDAQGKITVDGIVQPTPNNRWMVLYQDPDSLKTHYQVRDIEFNHFINDTQLVFEPSSANDNVGPAYWAFVNPVNSHIYWQGYNHSSDDDLVGIIAIEFECNGKYETDADVCSSGGKCIGFNNCDCNEGYSGTWCEVAPATQPATAEPEGSSGEGEPEGEGTGETTSSAFVSSLYLCFVTLIAFL